MATDWAKRASAEIGAEEKFRKLGTRLTEVAVPSQVISLVNKPGSMKLAMLSYVLTWPEN